MRKKYLILMLGLAMSLSGCTSGSGSGSDSVESVDSVTNGFNGASFDTSKSVDEDFNESYSEDFDSGEIEENEELEISTSQDRKIDTDMLVYSCHISVDTLDYDKSLVDFKKLLDETDGFIENEEYSDNGGSYSYYYIEDSDKHSEYDATVRIPSSKYDDFINSLGDIGDVRSKNSSVENMNQEYRDAETALKIYKEQEKRYIEMIATVDESYALQLQEQLTDVEIQIAQLESSMNKIETDVAYSYVYLNLREVEKYSLHGKTDTFFMRLKDNFSGSWDAFLAFLEGVLTFVIYAWYYIVILIGVVVLIRKRLRKKRKNKSSINSVKTYDLGLNKEGDSDEADKS